jgi:hypothetical protein
MSSKKMIITNNILFAKNINRIVDDKGGKYVFADAIGVSYDAVRQWCIGENLPDGKRLLAIRDKFKVSIDWLLTGTEANIPTPGVAQAMPHYQCPFCSGMSDETKELCKKVKDIMESKHKYIAPALSANIDAFHYSIEKEKEQDNVISPAQCRSHRVSPFSASTYWHGQSSCRSPASGSRSAARGQIAAPSGICR